MHHFHYKNNKLYAEGVPLTEIAEAVGTPCYIYSQATLTHHFKVFDNAFSDVPHLTCYSVKANSNIALLKLFASLGGGVDVVSGGELFRALKADVSPKKIVFSGVGKTEDEIKMALEADILMFNVESEAELETIHEIASHLGKIAPIALRVNPDIDPKTHPYISTGLKKSKFGIDIKIAEQLYLKANHIPHIRVIGIDCHIGSQLTLLSPFLDALERIKLLYQKLEAQGLKLQYLDLGGGLGIPYGEEIPPHPTEYAQAIKAAAQDLNCTLIFEPGRVIVGNAGILLTKVLYLKQGKGKTFIIVDAAMNDLIRPSLYHAHHEIKPVEKMERPLVVADVVGPICETGDFFAQGRKMPLVQSGDLLAIMSAGAYGFVMSSNYNSRPRVAEVLVNGDRYQVIRKRECYEDLIRLEKIPEWMA
ncbi:diaminopimelate decarboxylase [Candidatus Desulfofervidus auxilii]|uniref:Diaminopimelate decarboxylase n=1 Tax=Desulfofervidus auxilii TaxID=1621989 RepID=A0A7U4QIN0_DESA2|nr:diaminopimelate decarboxylase [Candidatus Desulfofervidus auxilii]AMM40065.1 diaminopimelate decarboxylase [Candidatus Desulfofervidus auxilii]